MTRMWVLIFLQMLMIPLATPCSAKSGEPQRMCYSRASELQLSKGHRLSTIPKLGKEWKLSFMFKPTAFTYQPQQWTGIFSIHDSQGRFSPGIFYRPDSGLIHKSEIDGKTKQWNHKPSPAPLGQWTSVTVKQQKSTAGYIYIANIGGEINFTLNKKPTEFNNIAVFASSPGLPARPGSIKDITISSNTCDTCKCGIQNTSPHSPNRIVGGRNSEVFKYPWIAIFAAADGTISARSYCASTLIANNWAVTAAHCVVNNDGTPKRGRTPTTMSVVLGVHDRTDTTNALRKVVPVAEIIAHPDYMTETDNDIALLKLGESVDLTTYTPACLPAQGADFTGKDGWVYGWGKLAEDGLNADLLQELKVPIVSDATCRAAMAPKGLPITADMLCAGGVEGEDACTNDSGGPLTVDVDGKHTLVGDVSGGIGCATAGLYGVYAETLQDLDRQDHGCQGGSDLLHLDSRV